MRYLLISLLIFCRFGAVAQLLDSLALDTAHVYTSLESAMKNPEAVYRLSLRHLKLKTVPAEVLSLPNIQWLDLSKNRIEGLPSGIGNLKYLQVLNISRNRIRKLPAEIGLLHHLVVLHAGENDLFDLPEQITGAERLEILDIWSNNITFLPEGIKDMPAMRIVDMRAIQLSHREQAALKEAFPNLKFFFSAACNCD